MKQSIRIVKYAKDSNIVWINKLYDLSFNGKKIVYVEYNTYSNPAEFIPSQPLDYSKIIKIDYDDGVSYRIGYLENMSTCGYLISFNKNSVVEAQQ